MQMYFNISLITLFFGSKVKNTVHCDSTCSSVVYVYVGPIFVNESPSASTAAGPEQVHRKKLLPGGN